MKIKDTKIYAGICLLCAICLCPAQINAAKLNSADEYYEDALSYYHKKNFKKAIIQLKNALQLDQKHLSAKILLGESYLGSGEPVAAEVQLRRAR